MNTLLVPLSHLTDKGLTIRAVVTAADLLAINGDEVPQGSVTVTGTLTELGDEYLFRGEVSGSLTQPCDRCLEPATFPFRVEVCWTYVEAAQDPAENEWDNSDNAETPGDDDEFAIYRFHSGEIDLRPQVCEEVALAMPAKFLCSTECAGLCPSCGANLNQARCACSGNETLENKGLAGLGDLFPELRPKSLEG